LQPPDTFPGLAGD